MGTLEFPEALDRSKLGQPPKDSAPKPKPGSGGGRKAPLQRRLEELITSAGVLVAMANEVDGLSIIHGAERLSNALDKAAEQNPAVRRALEAVLTGSVWGEVVLASGAIALPIAINHRMLPASLTGFIPVPVVEVPTVNQNGNAELGDEDELS